VGGMTAPPDLVQDVIAMPDVPGTTLPLRLLDGETGAYFLRAPLPLSSLCVVFSRSHEIELSAASFPAASFRRLLPRLLQVLLLRILLPAASESSTSSCTTASFPATTPRPPCTTRGNA
jgi:hypothetical protein